MYSLVVNIGLLIWHQMQHLLLLHEGSREPGRLEVGHHGDIQQQQQQQHEQAGAGKNHSSFCTAHGPRQLGSSWTGRSGGSSSGRRHRWLLLPEPDWVPRTSETGAPTPAASRTPAGSAGAAAGARGLAQRGVSFNIRQQASQGRAVWPSRSMWTSVLRRQWQQQQRASGPVSRAGPGRPLAPMMTVQPSLQHAGQQGVH